LNATSGLLGGSGEVAIARRDKIGGVTRDEEVGKLETKLALRPILTTENLRGGGRSSPSLSSSSSS